MAQCTGRIVLVAKSVGLQHASAFFILLTKIFT
jgi:hypothetical protein